jgi:cytochrome oxidase Cu insertion factor (SCO1/SenC/PrrC family)
MKHAALVFWLALLLMVAVFYGSWLAWRQHGHGGASDSQASAAEGQPNWARTNLPPGSSKPLPDFAFTDQAGHEFHSRTLRGQVWVASFFFASCPGPCYRLNQALAGLQAESDFKPVKFVSITCDPQDDTPEVLKEYAARFAADPKQWIFLTGDLKKILDLGERRFMLPIAERSHSELAVVLDKNSTVRGYFHLTDDDDVTQIRIRLRALLAEPEPEIEPLAADAPRPPKTASASLAPRP